VVFILTPEAVEFWDYRLLAPGPGAQTSSLKLQLFVNLNHKNKNVESKTLLNS